MRTMRTGYDAIVVGAGIWGCTVARRCAERGQRVLVLERRAAVGGNVRCETDPETGIEIHSYGSHIFHTHNREVWDFIRRFTEFNGYQHKVLACYRGRVYHLPLGLTLINKFFGVELKPGEVEGFLAADANRRQAIFDAFFRGYTSKQWGKPPEEIDPSIIRRVPVRANYDTNYFNDYWQGIPADGYNALFDKLLDHPNITIRCDCEFKISDIQAFEHSNIYYSGPLDRLFDYKFGALPWRSLRFELEKLPVSDYQGTSVVNYTEASIPYTRIHEFKHYHPELKDVMASGQTVIMREFPQNWKPGDEPYYPVNNAESAALQERYLQEAARFPQLTVGGRLGNYRYYDMDQAMAAALALEIE